MSSGWVGPQGGGQADEILVMTFVPINHNNNNNNSVYCRDGSVVLCTMQVQFLPTVPGIKAQGSLACDTIHAGPAAWQTAQA